MKLVELIDRFRRDRKDTSDPFFWSDDQIVDWLNEAEVEACIRADLLIDETTDSITLVTVGAGVSSVQLDQRIIDVHSVMVDGRPIEPTSIEALNKTWPNWRNATPAQRPSWWVFEENNVLRLVRPPAEELEIRLRVSRLPLNRMTLSQSENTPEIGAIHHIKLLDWAHSEALRMPDAETIDLNKSAVYETRFVRSFGTREDAAVRRKHRNNAPDLVQFSW